MPYSRVSGGIHASPLPEPSAGDGSSLQRGSLQGTKDFSLALGDVLAGEINTVHRKKAATAKSMLSSCRLLSQALRTKNGAIWERLEQAGSGGLCKRVHERNIYSAQMRMVHGLALL